MKNIKIDNNSSDIFWLISMELDVAKASTVVCLGKSPDSDEVSHILAFDKLTDVELSYSDDMDSNYKSTFLGLMSDDNGSFILTTDEFEVSFKAQSFLVEEKEN